MKFFSIALLSTLALSGLSSLSAQEPNPTAGLIRARVVSEQIRSGRPSDIYIVVGNDKGLRFKENPVQQGDVTLPLSALKYVIYEPLEFREALDLYKNRKYPQALQAFKKVADAYKNARELPYNFAALAEFYEIECHARMMNLAELAKADTAGLKKILPMGTVTKQLEVVDLWKLAEKKNWSALILECQKMLKSKAAPLSNRQLAQVNYLLGLAYANTGKATEALDQFSTAQVIDSTESPEISKASILESLAIYDKKPEVVEFFAAPPQDPAKAANVPSAVRQAGSLVHALTGMLRLAPAAPKEYAKFQPYYKSPARPKQPAAPAAEEAKATAAPAAPAAPAKAPAAPAAAPAKK